MTKQFTKGQKVTYIAKWNEACDFAYTQATVVSCGAKQMVLECDATKVCMGRHFRPSGIDSHVPATGEVLSGTFARMTDGEAESFCNEKARVRKAVELAHLAKRRAEGENEFWAERNAKTQAALEAAPKAHERKFT